jgi:hypothetical protein
LARRKSSPPGARSSPRSPPGPPPILTLAREAAASGPGLAALLDETSAARLERMTVNARALSDAGHLRPGITLAQAADILRTYSSPEPYELLVLRRGRSAEHYGRFITQAMIAALLPPTATSQDAPADSPVHGAPARNSQICRARLLDRYVPITAQNGGYFARPASAGSAGRDRRGRGRPGMPWPAVAGARPARDESLWCEVSGHA